MTGKGGLEFVLAKFAPEELDNIAGISVNEVRYMDLVTNHQ